MDEWIGFSDEDLRRLKRQATSSAGPPSRKMGGPPSRGRQMARGKPQPRPASQRQQALPSVSEHQLPAEMKLTPTKPEKDVQPASKLPAADANEEVADVDEKSTSQEKKDEEEVPLKEVRELDQTEFAKKQLSTVEQFQLQQKHMEEQNKQKKKLLASALIARQHKAKTESVRLATIQREFAQLDQLLQVDVSIIRNKIEDASREFLDAQRRYDRAEREFIDAKMDLHSKSDLKEHLTEHLYTIIHQNEIRKAKKLTELMEKLDMEDILSSDDIKVELTCLPEMTPQMPTLGDTLHVPRTPTSAAPTSPILPSSASDGTNDSVTTAETPPATDPAGSPAATPETSTTNTSICDNNPEQKHSDSSPSEVSEEISCNGNTSGDVRISGQSDDHSRTKNTDSTATDQNDNISQNGPVKPTESPATPSPASS